MTATELRRERLTDLTFAMRIIAQQSNEDMSVLLSSIKPRDPKSQLALRRAAEQFASFSEQVQRYTRYVEGATSRKRPT
jgi:hypothetical protein